jgi:hypothetical protein
MHFMAPLFPAGQPISEARQAPLEQPALAEEPDARSTKTIPNSPGIESEDDITTLHGPD